MLRRLGRWAVVCALVFTIGAHWAVLQSVAWIGMAVSYSQNASLREALIKTFDGMHPCKLCKVVQAGKRSDKRREAPKPSDKLDLFCIAEAWVVKAIAFPPVLNKAEHVVFASGAPPPKPPPRPILG